MGKGLLGLKDIRRDFFLDLILRNRLNRHVAAETLVKKRRRRETDPAGLFQLQELFLHPVMRNPDDRSAPVAPESPLTRHHNPFFKSRLRQKIRDAPLKNGSVVTDCAKPCRESPEFRRQEKFHRDIISINC